MATLPLSVCLVSGAEAQRIGRCLRSVSDWAGEIVVVLNQEVRDGTEEAIIASGGRVIRHPWQGFRQQKNLVLEHATQPWVLSLDADEAVSPELRSEIHGFFQGDHARFAGVRFPRRSWFMGRWILHGDWYPDHVLRLCRRDAGQWAGSEEHPAVEVRGSVKTFRGDLLHF